MPLQAATHRDGAGIRLRKGKQAVGNLFGFGLRHTSDVLPLRIDHVDSSKPCRDRSVRHRRNLLRLALAAIKRPAEVIFVLAANPVARIPEIDRVSLVRHIPQHRPDLSIPDLVKKLPAKLEIVSLLVDAPASVANDINAVLYV